MAFTFFATRRADHILVIVSVDEGDADGRAFLFRLVRLSALVLLLKVSVAALIVGTGGLTSIGGRFPLHAEFDKVLKVFATLFCGWEKHVVVYHKVTLSIVLFVAEYDPGGALVVVVLREARVPHVLEPESCHADRAESFHWFVLFTHWALAWFHLS